MATPITAYKALSGVVYLTAGEADVADVEACVHCICSTNRAELMAVANGHTAYPKIIDALLFLADRVRSHPRPAEPE